MIQLINAEINLARQCTQKCLCCNHGSSHAENWLMQPEAMSRDLERLKGIVHFKLLCGQGGEPLINRKIEDFLQRMSDANIADRIGILSNGMLLHTMPDSFWETCARLNVNLRVTRYEVFTDEKLQMAHDKAKKFGVDFQPTLTVDTFLKIFKKQPDGGKAIWKTCEWRWCSTIHDGWFYRCPQAAFFPKQFLGMDEHIDGIPLEGINEEKLQAFIDREQPLATCAHCAGDQGSRVKWHETRNKEEWIREATEL